MSSEHLKIAALVAWVIALGGTAVAAGMTSLPNWLILAFAAIVPPLVVKQFWRGPEETISERIHNARR